jgi:myo-inositol 2-dehydrogenase/D-chiro-inositol 1-dehydrogenase
MYKLRHEVQPENWHIFEDAFALEANEFADAVLNDKPAALPLEDGILLIKIGRALKHAVFTKKAV